MTTVRTVLFLFLLLLLGGCGGVDWWPGRQPTAPDPFSFPAKTGVALNTPVESDPTTVQGLTADSSPISVTGATGSTYSINGATPTSAQGTVKNGDVVRVQHTSSSTVGTNTVTTLTIGGVTAFFTSTTVPIQAPSFIAVTDALPGQGVQTGPVTLVARDGLVGTHQVSITNGTYSLDTVNFFTSATQTIPNLNGRFIYLHTFASTTSGGEVDVTLTIDGVNSVWKVTTR